MEKLVYEKSNFLKSPPQVENSHDREVSPRHWKCTSPTNAIALPYAVPAKYDDPPTRGDTKMNVQPDLLILRKDGEKNFCVWKSAWWKSASWRWKFWGEGDVGGLILGRRRSESVVRRFRERPCFCSSFRRVRNVPVPIRRSWWTDEPKMSGFIEQQERGVENRMEHWMKKAWSDQKMDGSLEPGWLPRIARIMLRWSKMAIKTEY